MQVSASASNVSLMKHKLDVLMSVFPWVQMVVFSELAAFGPLSMHAQKFPNPAEDAFRDMAYRHKIWLVPGSMFQKRAGKIYNTATVINPNGEIVGRYDKLFPFYPYETGVTGGDHFLIFDVPNVGRFGITICYDMWFPETSRSLVTQGVEVILHPTLTGTLDRDVELSIVRATAATQQCYVFDINGLGDGGSGRSIICDPHGRVLHQAGTSPELMPLQIDLDQVRSSRERGMMQLGQTLKSFRDRTINFDIYNPGAHSPYLQSLGPLKKPARHVPKTGLTPLPLKPY